MYRSQKLALRYFAAAITLFGVMTAAGLLSALYYLELILNPAGANTPTVKRSPDSKSGVEIIFSHTGNAGPVIKDDDAFAGLLLIEFLVRVSNLLEPPPMAVQVIDRKPVA